MRQSKKVVCDSEFGNTVIVSGMHGYNQAYLWFSILIHNISSFQNSRRICKIQCGRSDENAKISKTCSIPHLVKYHEQNIFTLNTVKKLTDD